MQRKSLLLKGVEKKENKFPLSVRNSFEKCEKSVKGDNCTNALITKMEPYIIIINKSLVQF